MQSRGDYLEALGIPGFLYNDLSLPMKTGAKLRLMIIELEGQETFCKEGESQSLLIKMLDSIGVVIKNTQLLTLTKKEIETHIRAHSEEAILVMNSSYKSKEPTIFSTHHPSDILKNADLKRESWEVLKRIKHCLK